MRLAARPSIALAVLVLAAMCLTGRASAANDASILFVCEHGSIKSLIAASLFNATARERNVPFRGIARGVTPDPSIPPAIADALKREGFEVRRFKPTAVTTADAKRASHIVAIDVDLSAVTRDARASLEHWDDVPAASTNYAAAHAALKRHVDSLLDRLQSRAP
jgi:protein-tyrosine-phosphatase